MKVFGADGAGDVHINLPDVAEDLTNNMDKLNHFDQWMLQKISYVVSESERAFGQFQL